MIWSSKPPYWYAEGGKKSEEQLHKWADTRNISYWEPKGISYEKNPAIAKRMAKALGTENRVNGNSWDDTILRLTQEQANQLEETALVNYVKKFQTRKDLEWASKILEFPIPIAPQKKKLIKGVSIVGAGAVATKILDLW